MRIKYFCRRLSDPLVIKRLAFVLLVSSVAYFVVGREKLESVLKLRRAGNVAPPGEVVRLLEDAFDNNTLRCRGISMPGKNDINVTQDRWQVETSGRGRVYLYSAVYDDRPMADSRYVRINLMATKYSNMTLYCHLWYEHHSSEPYVRVGLLNETGINRAGFPEGVMCEFILSCPVPLSSPLPGHVSVTEEEPCKSPGTLLPVLHKLRLLDDPPVEFGVCVVNGHGSFTPQEMVEWFEFYRLMGAQEFNLYNTSYSGVDHVFDYYARLNVLTLDQIPHPLGPDGARLEYSTKKIRNLRTTCLNDCMMRNMHRYRYLVVVDHDEFIVPRGNLTNYRELMNASLAAIKVDAEVMSVGFRNAYFFKTFPPDLYKPVHMKTLRYRLRTLPLPNYTASKSILRPEFCFNLMNHYCYTPLPLYKGKISYFCPQELGLSHHYRYCGKFTGTRSCSQLHGDRIADDVMLKFEKPLRTNVEKVLSHLNIPYQT